MKSEKQQQTGFIERTPMKAIWLSHPLDTDTPLYGGDKGIDIRPDKSMARGDSCNTTILKLPAHAGSHVDAPAHFIADGLTITDYDAQAWIFDHPLVVEVPAAPGILLGPENLERIQQGTTHTDLLLIRTGFEDRRGKPVYWQNAPGIAPETADFLLARLPGLKAVGFDFISISSLAHREAGRAAHRAFLGAGLRIFEDLSLSALESKKRLDRVIALPLRVSGADGAPCTVVGFLR
ncbi:MAG: cyclase family protein [Desulfobacterales bacterium]|nr:cyclase family protein [Desulfobacterales bacterium]